MTIKLSSDYISNRFRHDDRSLLLLTQPCVYPDEIPHILNREKCTKSRYKLKTLLTELPYC